LTEIFQLRLLGPFQTNGANPAIPQRAKGLIAYLAMHAGRSISREALATLLWSYSASQQARQSLRQCLTDVRVTLGQAQQLETSRSAIRFTPAANADIDVHHFEVLAQSAEPDDLAAASELYRGEFLEGSTSIQNLSWSG
jgi:DNA-binding SARP family transcriptional activator